MSHHCVLHLKSFPFSYGALASVEYRRRSKVVLYGCLSCYDAAHITKAGRAQLVLPRPGAKAAQPLGEVSHPLRSPPRCRCSTNHPRHSSRCPRQPPQPAAFLVTRLHRPPSSSLVSAALLVACPRLATIVVDLQRAHGHARGRALPADDGHGHRSLPVASDGCGCGHEILLAGAGVPSHYPHGYYPLPSLVWSN